MSIFKIHKFDVSLKHVVFGNKFKLILEIPVMHLNKYSTLFFRMRHHKDFLRMLV